MSKPTQISQTEWEVALKEKLDAIPAPAAEFAPADSEQLFKKVLDARESVSEVSAISEEELQSSLRSYYQAPHFKAMPSFLGEAPMSVEVIECHLKLNEQKKVEDKESQDQFAQREERLQWVKTPIELKDLFQKRSLKPKEPEKEINKVLLVGEAGTGKTSLTKKLAHDWTVGNWGQELTAVYVLPVRAIKSDKYNNNGHPCRDANLSTAIANECFAENKGLDDFKKLRRCIEASLNNPSTLVILDGLDEQHGTSEAILREAKSGNHKLFLTSRPYGIETERSLVDMEVDHMGLDVAQRDSFVKHALQDSTGLLTFIQGHRLNQQQGDVPAMAHVPVNLKILCALWKEKSRKLLEQKAPMGLPSLYRELVDYVWERFEKQSQETTGRTYTPEDQPCLFQDLEKIALTGLESGEIIITPGTIKEAIGKRPYPLLQNAGLLLLQKVDRQYQFPHLTFQEYFTGRRLARQFLSGEQKAVTKFLRQHMYTPRYRRTLSFMSGEIVKGMPSEVGSTSSGEELAPIQALLHLAAELPKEILGLQYLVSQLRLLNEWLLVTEDIGEKAETMSSLEAKFHLGKNLIMWFNEGLRQYRKYGDKSTQVLYTTLMNLLSEASGVAKHYGIELRKHILNALKDSNWNVRRAVLEALRTLLEQGADVQELLLPILNALQDIHSDVRRATLEALPTLLEQGADVQVLLPPILNALQDSDSSVCSAALQALWTLVEKGADVQELLLPILNALQDIHSDVRRAALEALRTLLDQDADVQVLLPPILNALKDSASDVRRAALEALPTLAEKGADVQVLLPPILNALKDSASDVRRVALEALPTLAEKGADVQVLLPPILNALKDSDSSMRRAALQAVLRTLLEQGADVQLLLLTVLNALQDIHSDVRIAALEALPTLLKQGADVQLLLIPILNALQDIHSDVRIAALEALPTLLKQGADAQVIVPLMLSALQYNRCSDVRIAALEALPTLLKQVADVQVIVPLMLSALQYNRCSSVRRAAPQVLLEQDADVQGLLPPTLNALKDSDSSVRRAALQALRILLEQDADVQGMLPPILNALKDSDSSVRRAALEALRTLLEQDADVQGLLPPTLNALKDSDSSVRRAAREALGQISTESLTNYYWDKKDARIISALVPRLYEVALTIEESRNQVILYTGTGQPVEWTGSREELESFKQLIRTTSPYFTLALAILALCNWTERLKR